MFFDLSNQVVLNIIFSSKQTWGHGYARGYAIDAKSCFDPVCKFVKEYKEVTNNSKDNECSHYYWMKRQTTPHLDNGWNACYLKRNYFKLGYNPLTNEWKDRYQKFTIGITRCFEQHIHHQWGNAADTGIFL